MRMANTPVKFNSEPSKISEKVNETELVVKEGIVIHREVEIEEEVMLDQASNELSGDEVKNFSLF